MKLSLNGGRYDKRLLRRHNPFMDVTDECMEWQLGQQHCWSGDMRQCQYRCIGSLGMSIKMIIFSTKINCFHVFPYQRDLLHYDGKKSSHKYFHIKYLLNRKQKNQ